MAKTIQGFSNKDPEKMKELAAIILKKPEAENEAKGADYHGTRTSNPAQVFKRRSHREWLGNCFRLHNRGLR